MLLVAMDELGELGASFVVVVSTGVVVAAVVAAVAAAVVAVVTRARKRTRALEAEQDTTEEGC